MDNSTFEELIGVYKFFSRLAAVLPFEGRDFNFIVTRFLTLFLISCSFVNSTLTTAYVIDAFAQGSSINVADVYYSILSVCASLRYYMIMWYRKNDTALFEECKELWKFCDAKGRATVRSYERKVRVIYGIYGFSCVMFNIVLPIDAYMTRLPPLEPNGTEQRVLGLRWFVGHRPYNFLGYHAIFVIQLIVIQSVTLCALVFDGTTPGLLMLGAGYFHQLTDRLTDRVEDDLFVQNDAEIIRCIEYHQRLMKYCKSVNDLSQGIMLTAIIGTCYSVSLILIKLIGSDVDKYSHVPVMGVCLCQLFLFNWTPQVLADQSEGVAYAVYVIMMKRMSNKVYSLNLCIMLLRAQTPVVITAGGFVVLSLNHYGSMMNRAFSFFMVLRKLGI